MYTTILYGATLLALGAAMRDPENTLILEPSGLAGSEFIDALRFDSFGAPASAPGKALLRELESRGAAGGRAHMPAAAPALFLLAQQYGLQILFVSSLVSLREEEGGVTLEALCVHERRSFRARQFVRTDASLPLLARHGALKDVRIHALLKRGAGCALPEPSEEAAVLPAFYDGCALLSLRVDPRLSFASHRAKVMDHMRALSPSLAGSKLLSIASTLCVTAQPLSVRTGPSSRFVPSCGRRDMFDALDYGYEKGRDGI